MLNGIDISSHQAGLNVWNMTTCDFIVVKATEGTGYVNPYCDGWVQDTLNSGKKMGFYHFASGTDAIAEADYFVDNTLNYFGKGIPVLDFEADAVSRGVEWARMFMQRVYERTKVRCLIYMSESVVRQYDWSSVAADYGLWVASYPNVSRPGFDYGPWYQGYNGAWTNGVTMWQYASDGSIVGYNDSLDVNHFYGDTAAWDRIANGDREGEDELSTEAEAKIGYIYDQLSRTDDVTGRVGAIPMEMYSRVDHLKKGGRITPAVALLAGLLKIVPIMKLNYDLGGKIDTLDKVRTVRKANLKIISHMIEECHVNNEEYVFAIEHVLAEELALEMKQKIIDMIGECDILVRELPAVVGAHMGIGGIGYQFIRKCKEI